MGNELGGKRIAFLVANEGVEQDELTQPWLAVEQAGGQPVLVAPQLGDVQAFHHLREGEVMTATVATAQLSVTDFDGVVLPGGVANPDQLRMDDAAVSFLRAWTQNGSPVAAICHGPWTLIEADAVRGKTLTSWPSLRTDLRNAGGEWCDKHVVRCDSEYSLVTSRKPADLLAFCAELVAVFSDA